jgi:CHAT domain-containing protein
VNDHTVAGLGQLLCLCLCLLATHSVLAAPSAFPRAPQQPSWAELNNQVSELLRQGKYKEALPVAMDALQVAKGTYSPDHPNLATALDAAGAVFYHLGNYKNSEELYKLALEVQQNALRSGHRDSEGFATTLSNLGVLYLDEGRYSEAKPLLESSVEVGKKHSRPLDRANQMNNLGLLNKKQGNYAAAESYYLAAKEIREIECGADDPAVAVSLDNLAGLYLEQGKFTEAVALRQKSLEILEKTLPPDHPELAITRGNLAEIYERLGNPQEAERLLQKTVEARERTLGPNHPDVARSLDDLANVYAQEGKFDQAEPLFRSSEQYFERASGPNSLDLARSLNNLAAMYQKAGKYANAEKPAKSAVAIWENTFEPEHPTVSEGQANLALLYYALGRPLQAEPLFVRSIQSLKHQFDQQFAYMSESERLSFLESIEHRFPIYLSFCFTYEHRKPELVSRMYDLLLWQKGLVATSVAALRTRLASGGNTEALAMLDQLTAKRTELAKLRSSQPKDQAQWRNTVSYLEQQANELERELVEHSPEKAEEKRRAFVTWQDVQKHLKKEEAAIEFVRFRFHDGKEWTAKAYYAALIVSTETKAAPVLIFLGEAKELEGSPLNDYRKHVGLEKNPNLPDKPGFYAAFWKPLEIALVGKKHLYVSPDGVLNQVPLAAVSDDKGRLLMEKYDFEELLSTQDFMRTKNHTSRTAVLVGNPKFDLTEAEQRVAIKNLLAPVQKEALTSFVDRHAASEEELSLGALDASPNEVAKGIRSRDEQARPLEELPETAEGIRVIHNIVEKYGWQAEDYTEERALEETVKHVPAPRILHLATHGFFEPNQERVGDVTSREPPSGGEDPMLRSGLYFAGADRALRHETVAPDLEDGVLTAYEATGLSLVGTEIVTLAACDTGLGETKNSEGVFGLRRALQEAGADSILMSMWSVPAIETQELMALFYEKWLGGMDKYKALDEAQLAERAVVEKRYRRDVPYYWAAWVLVGR